jgi:phosphoribosylformylglycinamidine (FGAM) synthase PurS component
MEMSLKIPDNEAYTALTTLAALGVELAALRRADLWRFTVDDAAEATLTERVRTLETIYNPNKHELRMRGDERPEPGEVWVDEPGHGGLERPVRIAGKELTGVARVTHATAWRLTGKDGAPASPAVVEQAVKMLLCNPAFQKVIL